MSKKRSTPFAVMEGKVLELQEMIIHADEFGNDHNDRREMRVLFMEIKEYLLLELFKTTQPTNEKEQ